MNQRVGIESLFCRRFAFMTSSGMRLIMLTSVFVGASLLQGQAPDQTHVGQFSQAEILRGSQVYGNTCAVCHGLNGNALVTVDLARNRFRDAVTDDDLRRVIRSEEHTSELH